MINLIGFQFMEHLLEVIPYVMVLNHIAVAFVPCQIIAADASGENKYLVRFLSKELFVRYSKLTYAVYLINPIVIVFTFGMLGNGILGNLVEFVSGKLEILYSYEKLIFCLADNHELCGREADELDCFLYRSLH
jgi:peptidoglycan/LPS O-acetylase OafA/YrhL